MLDKQSSINIAWQSDAPKDEKKATKIPLLRGDDNRRRNKSAIGGEGQNG